MFNYVGVDDAENAIEIQTYGSTSGLQLVVRVAQDNALDLLRRELGARVVIHDPHFLPFVSEYGVNVRPRDMTAVELSMSEIYRLGKPWGNCEDSERKIAEEPYSILACEKHCGYQQMAKHCNCTMRHYLRGTVLNKATPSYPVCNISDDAQRNCVLEVTEDIERDTDCNCRPPCRETVYSYSVTASDLNINYFKAVKAIRTLSLDSDGERKYINYSDEKSMVGVKVYYNAFQVSKHSEVAGYSWETLVANIGGNLGFFMGLTLVTFLEIAEFIWDFICTACCGISARNRVHNKYVEARKIISVC